MAAEEVYTLAVWRASPAQETALVEAWKALGDAFARLPRPPAGAGTLLQSVTDPGLYYQFRPWHTLDDIQAMRSDAQAQDAIRRLWELCTEAIPGAFRVVARSG